MARLLIISILLVTSASTAKAWRSALYPTDWSPGYRDGAGRFLHDFSYAGYRAGEAPIPDAPPGPTRDVTAAPYSADSSGASDATDAIQRAIDDVGGMGGGIVYLPAGTYRVSLRPGHRYALLIQDSGVVLRGAGVGRTHLLNTTTVLRDSTVVQFAPREEYFGWHFGDPGGREITADLLEPTTTIPLADTDGLAAGDWVVVRADASDAWIAEHGMTGWWTTFDTVGPMFYRRIVRVRSGRGEIEIDAPTRYPLRRRDNARVHRPRVEHIEEVGIEQLSIGNLDNDTPGMDTHDWNRPGTGGYEVHASVFVHFDHVVNGWMRDVSSYRPPENGRNVHLLSSGVRFDFSRFLTAERVHLANPQYEGAGGNGYLFSLTANDCLLTNSSGTDGRHNFNFAFPWSNGNVVHATTIRDARLPSDFHQRLSMANLIDNVTVDGDYLEAAFRDCCTHGHAATQNVFWNIEGLSYSGFLKPYIIESQQFGHGYVIGTRGPASGVWIRGGDGTEPRDLLEGQGMGTTLEPASLFLDQRRRRLGGSVDNAAPFVDAGADATVIVPSMLPLAGTVDDDGFPDPPGALTTRWVQTAGAEVVIADPTATTTTAAFTLPGIYSFRLDADDGEHTTSDEITVRAESAGTDPPLGDGGTRPEDAGTRGDAETTPRLPPPPSAEGCSCSTPAGSRQDAPLWAMAAATALVFGRRRFALS